MDENVYDSAKIIHKLTKVFSKTEETFLFSSQMVSINQKNII